jgi:hypothetical protein
MISVMKAERKTRKRTPKTMGWGIVEASWWVRVQRVISTNKGRNCNCMKKKKRKDIHIM